MYLLNFESQSWSPGYATKSLKKNHTMSLQSSVAQIYTWLGKYTVEHYLILSKHKDGLSKF